MADPISPIPAHFTDLSCLIWSIFDCLASVSLATIKIRQKKNKEFQRPHHLWSVSNENETEKCCVLNSIEISEYNLNCLSLLQRSRDSREMNSTGSNDEGKSGQGTSDFTATKFRSREKRRAVAHELL